VNQYWIIALLASYLIAGGAAWEAKGWKDAKTQQIALNEQETALHAQCDKEKATTKEANDALQNDRIAIAARLADRVSRPLCITPIGVVANHTAGRAGHAGNNGFSVSWLRSFAASCETYRREVIVLNNFGIAERAK